MKKIIPLKLILTQDGNGNVTQAILQYKISINGAMPSQVNSISVLTALTLPTLDSLFSTAVMQANQSEGL